MDLRFFSGVQVIVKSHGSGGKTRRTPILSRFVTYHEDPFCPRLVKILRNMSDDNEPGLGCGLNPVVCFTPTWGHYPI